MKSRFDDNVNLDQDNSSSIKIETETTTNTTPNYDDSSSSIKEEVIPLMAEKLNVIKTELVDEAIITKEPVKETKTKQIPNMHEELVIERKPVIDDSLSSVSNNNNNFSTGYENEEFKPVENKCR